MRSVLIYEDSGVPKPRSAHIFGSSPEPFHSMGSVALLCCAFALNYHLSRFESFSPVGDPLETTTVVSSRLIAHFMLCILYLGFGQKTCKFFLGANRKVVAGFSR